VNAANAPALVLPVIPPHPSSPRDGWLTAFPLRSFLVLGAYPTAPGSARGHARNVLEEWRLGHLADAVLMVVSELVTNAVTATGRVRWEAELPPVGLWLLGGAGEVLVLVWDAVAELPEKRDPGAEDESGRGLGIVDHLSRRQWGAYLPPSPFDGKVTQALVDRPWRDDPP
jgi:hypothetical protein